jgi:tRNA (guanine6-N2)-methyltransferase
VTYYAQTMPGVEQITWLEIRSRLARAAFGEFLFGKEQNGVVTFEYDGRPQDLLQLRTAEDVFLLALSLDKLSRDWGDLRLVANQVAESETFGRAANQLKQQRRFKGRPTFRVIARKYGQHQYRRKDLEEAVIKGVERRFGRGWQFVEDNADIEIWANLFGSRLLAGLRLSDRGMRHRYERLVEMPASLRPSVAAAMVFLTEAAGDDRFVDPFGGSGTILLERAHVGPAGQMIGGDIEKAALALSRQNLAGNWPAGVRPATLVQWDAGRLPLATGWVDKMATNPPFGKQIGSPQAVKRLYPRFFAEMERVLRPGGRAVVLSSEFELVKQVMRERPGLEILTGYSVAVLGQWGRIYLIRRKE